MNNYSLSNFRHLPSSSVDDLKKMSFDSSDVLTQSEDLRVRQTNIEKAIALKSSTFLSTALILKTQEGSLYKFETKVTGMDSQGVYTSNGIKVPLVCIYSIDFY
jgi:hypothetical protein